MSRNPDLITLRNGQYNRSRRSRAVKRFDIQTLIKVGGGSNPNFLFFLNKMFFFSFDVMAKQTSYRYSTDAKQKMGSIVIDMNIHPSLAIKIEDKKSTRPGFELAYDSFEVIKCSYSAD